VVGGKGVRKKSGGKKRSLTPTPRVLEERDKIHEKKKWIRGDFERPIVFGDNKKKKGYDGLKKAMWQMQYSFRKVKGD